MRAILAVWVLSSLVPVMGQPELQQISPSGQANAQPLAIQDSKLKTNGRSALGLKFGESTGGKVTVVLKDGPAARAGIQVGDEVLRVDGQDFKAVEQFRDRPPGSQIRIEYRRGATIVQTLVVTEDQLSLYTRLATIGDADAEVSMGRLYVNGDGVAKDYAEALKWWQKAAESGSAEGQDLLGWMYETGVGVAKDEKTALEWYQKAAAQGQADAEYRVGTFYEHGRVVPTEKKAAIDWYGKAAAQGSARAENRLGVMYLGGQGVSRDDTEALKWFQKAAGSGLPEGEVCLGWMYETGVGVAKDEKTALEWYQKAAAQGYGEAEYRVGTFYEHGWVVPADKRTATDWYSKAGAHGYEYAKAKMLALDLPEECTDSFFKYQIRWPGLAHYIVRDVYEKQIRQDSSSNITSKEFEEGPNNTAVVKYVVQIGDYSPQNYTIRISNDGIYTTWTGGPSTSFFGVLFDESDSNLHQSSLPYSQLLPVRKVRHGDIEAHVPLIKKDKDRDKFENSKDWALVPNQQIKGVDDADRFADALNLLICDAKGAAALHQRQWEMSIQSLRAKVVEWRAQPGQGELPEQARDEQIMAKQSIDEKDMVGVILHYQKALDAYPMLPKAWFNSALAYEQIGAYKEAAEFMKVYVELVPNAPDSQEARAKVVVWEDKARGQ